MWSKSNKVVIGDNTTAFDNHEFMNNTANDLTTLVKTGDLTLFSLYKLLIVKNNINKQDPLLQYPNLKKNHSLNYNHGHILRLFDILPNILFIASETKRDY